MPKPKKVIASLDTYRRSHSDHVESWKSLYNSIVDSLEPGCPHEPFREDTRSINALGSVPVRDVGVQSENPVDDIPVEVVPEPGRSGNETIHLDSSSDDDSKKRQDVDSKENVLLESLALKTVISSLKKERIEDQKSLLHYIVMENLPLAITDGDLERDVFSLVGIDRRSLALNIQRHKTESIVQVYTNDMNQVQKLLACDKKLVVGGRVLATRIGTTGRI